MTIANDERNILEWQPVNGCHVDTTYFLDGVPLGRGDAGFDEVLRLLRLVEPGSRLVVRSPLLIPEGGGQFGDEFPFAARRQDLDLVVTERQLRVEYLIS